MNKVEQNKREEEYIEVPNLAKIVHPSSQMKDLEIKEGDEICIEFYKKIFKSKSKKNIVVELFAERDYLECLRCKTEPGLMNSTTLRINKIKTEICADCAYVIFRDYEWGEFKDEKCES